MSLSSSRRKNKPNRNSVYREVSSARFIGIRTINEIEDIIDTSEAYMTDPTVIFNSDNTKVLFYYDTKNKNEIEEMETLFKRTATPKSTITLSDASYLDESSGDDTTYDISGTYRFEKYDATTKTIVAAPISVNKQSTTYLTYNSKYWLGSLLWTTSDTITTKTTSYEIVNFIGNSSNQSFNKVFGTIQPNDKIEIVGLGTFTVLNLSVDSDEGWERIKVKEKIPEKDYLGELTFIRLLRSGMDKKKTSGGIILDAEPVPQPDVSTPYTRNSSADTEPLLNSTDINILNSAVQATPPIPLSDAGAEDYLKSLGMSKRGIDNLRSVRNSIQEKSMAYAASKRQKQQEEYEQTPKDKAKEAWLSSGSKTLNVTVISTTDGNKFSINGDNPDDFLELDVGATVLIKQSDKSNGSSGFTRKNHPLRFSIIEDGPHRGGSASSIDYISNKSVGNNGSYYYFKVPSVGKLFYYCEYHPGMGKEIMMGRPKGACCSKYDSCKPGGGARKCYSNKSESECTSTSGLDGLWHKGKKCKKRKGSYCCDPSWDEPEEFQNLQDDKIEGACCLADGSCVVTFQKNCTAFNATWMGAKSCDDVNCSTYTMGACCNKCDCKESIYRECKGKGDKWISGEKCPTPVGGINPCCPPDDNIKGHCCIKTSPNTSCFPRRRCIKEKTAYECEDTFADGIWHSGDCSEYEDGTCCAAGNEP